MWQCLLAAAALMSVASALPTIKFKPDQAGNATNIILLEAGQQAFYEWGYVATNTSGADITGVLKSDA
jgi:hypothetical protein